MSQVPEPLPPLLRDEKEEDSDNIGARSWCASCNAKPKPDPCPSCGKQCVFIHPSELNFGHYDPCVNEDCQLYLK
jgi:hypothetical protein